MPYISPESIDNKTIMIRLVNLVAQMQGSKAGSNTKNKIRQCKVKTEGCAHQKAQLSVPIVAETFSWVHKEGSSTKNKVR